jgi:hypothetical protein
MKTFFKNDYASVTNEKVVISGATYLTEAIVGVRVTETRDGFWPRCIGMLSIFAGLYFLSYGMMCSGAGVGVGNPLTLTGFGLVGFGALLFFYVARRVPAQYFLILNVGGGEVAAASSPSVDTVNELAAAITRAISP